MSFFSKLLKVMRHKKYQKNPLGKKLSPLQQSVLNIGAVNAEQTMYYCDSLETGSEKGEIRNNLAAYYDIIDEESALHTPEWLLERGHRVYFDAIKLFSAGISPSITDEILTPDEQLDTPRYMKNIKEMIESLTEKGYISSQADLRNQSVLAWDMGRLVLIARCCFECGYITEEKAWYYMEEAHKKCCTVYGDWKEFASGYVIGRCMWGGMKQMPGGIMGIAEGLLRDPESPWQKVQLHVFEM